MKESFWAVFIIGIGVTSIGFIYLFQTITNTDEHNMYLLKETAEAAMYDAFDLAAYRVDGTVRIDKEKFVESFVRRFAENAALSRTYLIEIYDINEIPPKVSLKVSSSETGTLANGGGSQGDIVTFDISNTLDAILETTN